MKELIEIKPDINVSKDEYKRLLGYPKDFKMSDRAGELTDWATNWYKKNGKPWFYAVVTDQIDNTKEHVFINGIELESKILFRQFSQADVSSAVILIVSAGKECEEMANQLWLEGKPDEYFFLEVYGSAVVEHLVTTAGFQFCEWTEKNNLAVLPHYSPGYAGWKVEDQSKIMTIFEAIKEYDLPGKIELFDTGMLNPKKSMLALFGITKQVNKVRNLKDLIPCESCSLMNCNYRRTTYKNPRKQIEDVRRLQSFDKSSINAKEFSGSALTQNAKYSVNRKALQKWSDERLQINILDDNSVEAKFRYEGTTCSNMGRKLEFDYDIRLSSNSEGYKIIQLVCRPLEDDDGFKFMCEYIKNPELILNNIKNEKPLFGQPLDDVLWWERDFSPEGCFCNSESRRHKWGLVFEVLHYTLVQQENKNLLKKVI